MSTEMAIQDQSPGNNGFHHSLIFDPKAVKDTVTAVDAPLAKPMTRPGDGARKTDGGELTAKVVAGDHGIPDVTTLLEKVTDKKEWDGEDQDVGQGPSTILNLVCPVGRTHVAKNPHFICWNAYRCQHTP